jgi:hypothetical protein
MTGRQTSTEEEAVRRIDFEAENDTEFVSGQLLDIRMT